MVKKLFKYEFFSYARTLLPINLILIGISIMGRLIQFLENDGIPYRILFNSTQLAVGIAITASLLLTFVIAIVRFYRNLFGAEGYLSFTLPVTPAQHIWVKLATASLFLVITVFSILLSLAIMTAGEYLVEIFKAIGYLLKQFFDYLKADTVFYLLEFLLALAVSVAYSYLLFYTCIAIGQRSKKNRILMAGLAYFVFYMIGQAIATVLIIILAILDSSTELLYHTLCWIVKNPIPSVHIVFIASIVIYAALSVACFCFTHYTVKHKLNLE